MSQILEICVPELGDYKDVPVIELFVKPGDTIRVDEPICSLESDKATMEVPSSNAGVVQEVRVNLGDKVSAGAVLITLKSVGPATPATLSVAKATNVQSTVTTVTVVDVANALAVATTTALPLGSNVHAAPSVRAYARQLGVDLCKVLPSGSNGRIVHNDVAAYIKNVLRQTSATPAATLNGGSGLDLLPWPKVDFEKFGPVDRRPRSRIQKISAANLHRNWVMMPHVTNFDEADITDLESFRQQINSEQGKDGTRLSLLAFLIKALVNTLKAFPDFNSSLDGEETVQKRYWHIGFAADTLDGLMVPVIHNADQKSVLEIARESGELAKLARGGKLKPEQMQGGTFTISSLGGIGGTSFTPIINAPEVAILGVNKAATKAVWDGKQFVPRLILPMSLSWDHRAVDGAEAARFLVHLARLIADMRRMIV
jgi:pyruvate dehydrogenase E2 component (dihydrolipoamide acetyltransferase)